MNYRKTSLEQSNIDNFSIKSKGSDKIMWEPKEDKIRRKEKQ